MNENIRVGSVEQLKAFRVSLCRFASVAAAALDEAGGQIQRTLTWLQQDRYMYWKGQERQRAEKYAKARLELKLKKDVEKSPMGGNLSFIDEKKALAAAQRELEVVRGKMEKIRQWLPRLEKELFTYKGQVQGLLSMVDVEIPNARAQLDRMIDSLEAYLHVAPEAGVAEMAGVAEAAPMTRDTEPVETPGNEYHNLRKKAPPAEVREQTPMGEGAGSMLKGIKVGTPLNEMIAGVAIERKPVSAEQKVVMDRTLSEAGRIVLERAAPAAPADSGWTIGSIGGTETQDYVGISIGELLNNCPDLSEILTLAPGYLVVLNSEGIEAILNPDNEIVSIH
ncbi:MAG: hypothetical protein JW860_13635 [Sedimentisphaerales bacterium]|nr:hypothetical protein [Sedimentisphaerales bacterium]